MDVCYPDVCYQGTWQMFSYSINLLGDFSLPCVSWTFGIQVGFIRDELGYGKSERGHYSAGALVLEFPHRWGIFSLSHRVAVLLTNQTRISGKAGTAYGVNVRICSVRSCLGGPHAPVF